MLRVEHKPLAEPEIILGSPYAALNTEFQNERAVPFSFCESPSASLEKTVSFGATQSLGLFFNKERAASTYLQATSAGLEFY